MLICLLFNPCDLLSKYYLLFVNYTENEITINEKIIYIKSKTESTKQVIDFKRIKEKTLKRNKSYLKKTYQRKISLHTLHQ